MDSPSLAPKPNPNRPRTRQHGSGGVAGYGANPPAPPPVSERFTQEELIEWAWHELRERKLLCTFGKVRRQKVETAIRWQLAYLKQMLSNPLTDAVFIPGLGTFHAFAAMMGHNAVRTFPRYEDPANSPHAAHLSAYFSRRRQRFATLLRQSYYRRYLKLRYVTRRVAFDPGVFSLTVAENLNAGNHDLACRLASLCTDFEDMAQDMAPEKTVANDAKPGADNASDIQPSTIQPLRQSA